MSHIYWQCQNVTVQANSMSGRKPRLTQFNVFQMQGFFYSQIWALGICFRDPVCTYMYTKFCRYRNPGESIMANWKCLFEAPRRTSEALQLWAGCLRIFKFTDDKPADKEGLL